MIGRVVFAGVAGLWTSACLSAGILDEGLIRCYVERFNAGDDELYSNAIPNSAAADFLAANVPRFECPDKDIERTYYFRWWTFRKHLRKTPSGWVITEFLPPVGWAGKENTISCPMGHHQAEGRWLRDGRYVADYTRFMVTEGRTHEKGAYACWPATGLLKWRDVTGDEATVKALLPGLVSNYEGWEKGWTVKRWPRKGELRVGLCENGLFSMTDNYEGMEFSLGGDGYRPILNCAMESEARAIAEIARRAGDKVLSEKYAAKAAALAKLIRTRLWNEERQFFTVLSPEGRLASVRELCGYAPWYFGLKLDVSCDNVWGHMMREDGFLAPWGLTFPERTAPGFEISYEGHDCLWNGPSWPYATSLALTALANRLQSGNGVPAGLTTGSFAYLLHKYAASHVFVKPDGTEVPWIDEDQNPFTGDWIARTKLLRHKGYMRERGKDYNHSTFCDLVISGLCGFCPQRDGSLTPKPLAPAEWDWWCLDGVRYHGRDVTILFDRDGKRYGKGAGLVVLKDGAPVAVAADPVATMPAFARHRFADAPVKVYYDAYKAIEAGDPGEVAVVLIHGWGGHVRKVLPAFVRALADRAGGFDKAPFVIAPLFPNVETMPKNGEPDDGRATWCRSWCNRRYEKPGDAADDWRGGGDANGTSFSSFDYIDLILARFADRRHFPNLKRVVLAGFSAGGQFAGRYAAVGKGTIRDGVRLDYIAMSPSTEFRFEREDEWLYGLKGRPRYSAGLSEEDIMRNLTSRRVWRGCGSADTKGRPQTALDITPCAVRQGENRYARFKSFERYLEKYPDWKRMVSFHTFEGLGHDECRAYPDPALLDFVFKGDAGGGAPNNCQASE